MPLFATCARCGKKKLAFLLDGDGICSQCQKEITNSNSESLPTGENTESPFSPAPPDYEPPKAPEGPVIVFIDVETTGLNPREDSIVQVSALRYFGEKAVDGLNTYVDPRCPIPSRATQIHGITDDMVHDAPEISQVKEPFLKLIDGAVLVGYNTSFDLAFLDMAFDGALVGVKYLDLLHTARDILTLPNYKLETVADYLGFIPDDEFHNSMTDCMATAYVFFHLGLQDLLDYPSVFNPSATTVKSRKTYPKFRPSEITPGAPPVDGSHPLYGKTIVFTGELTIPRKQAAQMAVDAGAIVKNSISKRVNILVVGEQDLSLVGEDGMSTKEERAYCLNESGAAEIEVICEQEFYSLFEESVLMSNQISLAGFEPISQSETDFLEGLRPSMEAAVEMNGGVRASLTINPTKPGKSASSGYTAVKLNEFTAFRLKLRGKQQYISVPTFFADLIPASWPQSIAKSELKYIRLPVNENRPASDYTDFVVRVAGETVNRYPKEWDCCSRYEECSNAKQCVHPDKAFALACGYRKILNSGKVYFGANRNV